MKSTIFLFQTLCILFSLLHFIRANEPIKLHIFLHSHLDEGWIYTYDQYYKGTSSDDGGCVKCIFDNVYGSLLKNPDRKYQLSETSFFKRWWSEQSEDRKANWRKFIDQKQVEFINGGWSANDEACTYYEDIVENFIFGHRWLHDEFGLDPNIGWQIDSFGHSATHAALMAQAGYDSLFFGRIDFQDWEKRRKEQTLEFNWRPQNPHNETLLGHALYVHYSDTKFMISDNYYCRSIFCRGRLSGSQYQTVAEWITKQSKSFKTRNVAMLVGDDFHLWKEAEKDFDGIEAMINHFKNNPTFGIEAKFSTLSQYIQEVSQDFLENPNQEELPSKYGDFFPYIENEWTSWVGYYTSKSMFKLKIREISQYYNSAKLIFSKFILTDNQITEKLNKALNGIEDILSVVQHHDSATGTMRENVKRDYERLLDLERNNVDKEIISLLKQYSAKLIGEVPNYIAPLDFDWRQRNPLLSKAFESEKKVLVNVFNPGETDKFLVKIKVPTYKYKVLNETNHYLVVDIICNDQEAKADCYIYFVDEIKAYSLKSYVIMPSALSKRIVPSDISGEQELKIGNEVTINIHPNLLDFSYKICPQRNSPDLFGLFPETECLEDTFNLNYEFYESHVGSGLQVSSGAYIFRPKTNNKKSLSSIQSGRVFQGRYLTLIQIQRKDVRTDMKFVHHELDRGIEIESYLEPVQWTYSGKEIVIMLRSKTVLNKDQTFYTDANGYYMQKRKIDHRDDFTSRTPDIKIPSNYYPITSGIYIEENENKQRMTVLTDRAQGATSLNPGEIEIMIHRLTVQDDWKGLSEILKEQDPEGGMLRVSTRHYLMYSSPEFDLKHKQRVRQYKIDRGLQFWFANINKDTFQNPSSAPNTKFLDLESNIKLYIRSYKKNEFIIRFHNLDEANPKTVKIYDFDSKLFSLLNEFSGREDLKLHSVTELSLFTHKSKDQIKKNSFDPHQPDWKNSNDGKDLTTIELLPMEMRTFEFVLSE